MPQYFYRQNEAAHSPRGYLVRLCNSGMETYHHLRRTPRFDMMVCYVMASFFLFSPHKKGRENFFFFLIYSIFSYLPSPIVSSSILTCLPLHTLYLPSSFRGENLGSLLVGKYIRSTQFRNSLLLYFQQLIYCSLNF